MHKKFYPSHWFLKLQIFSLFPIVKMNANFAEICGIGNVEADLTFILLHCIWYQCRVAAVERLPVLYHSADYISFPLGSLGPLRNL